MFIVNNCIFIDTVFEEVKSVDDVSSSKFECIRVCPPLRLRGVTKKRVTKMSDKVVAAVPFTSFSQPCRTNSYEKMTNK